MTSGSSSNSTLRFGNHRGARGIQIRGGADALSFLLERVLRLVCRGLQGRSAGHDEVRKRNTLAVIDFVLSHTLRLFHPFLPFITEELWHGMGYHEEMPEVQGGRSIMFAPWPKPFDNDFRDHYSLDDCYVDFVNSKHELVTEGRNLRREANIPSNKKVKFIFKPGTGVPRTTSKFCSSCSTRSNSKWSPPDYEPPKGTPAVEGATWRAVSSIGRVARR